MLSYRHAYHAGNFADVLKHSVLTLVLEYMTRKDKGFSYIDSHSGAGMYSLTDPFAKKTGEYKEGIAKIIDAEVPESLLPYIELIQSLNNHDELSIYPGSPGIAKSILRRQDNANLYELHSTDHQLLEEFSERWRKAYVNKSDGYQGVLSHMPPPSRRGVVLIDPPYEIKNDYEKAVETVINAYKKFSSGTFIIWYPVVTRSYIETMEAKFKSSNVRNLLKVEFKLREDSEEYGMTGTGLFIVNPPWQLKSQLEEILPFMKDTIGTSGSDFEATTLIDE